MSIAMDNGHLDVRNIYSHGLGKDLHCIVFIMENSKLKIPVVNGCALSCMLNALQIRNRKKKQRSFQLKHIHSKADMINK